MVFAVKTSSVATTAFLVGLVFPFPHRELLLKTLYSVFDSSVLSCFLCKIKFSCSHFGGFVRLWYPAACLCFHLVFPFLGACSLVGMQYPWKGSLLFMPEDNNKWILFLDPFIISFCGKKIWRKKITKNKKVNCALNTEDRMTFTHWWTFWSLLIFLSL